MKIMFPHVWFSIRHQSYPNAWKDILLGKYEGGGAALQKYWDSINAWPGFSQLGDHHIIDKTACVPLFLHGDGAPITGVGKSWSMSASTWSLMSGLTHGPTILHLHAMCILWENSMIPGATMDEVFLIWGWSLYWLMRGVWPRTTHMRIVLTTLSCLLDS